MGAQINCEDIDSADIIIPVLFKKHHSLTCFPIDKLGEKAYSTIKHMNICSYIERRTDMDRLESPCCEENLVHQDAVEQVGISRSSFYKYKDDIFRFHDNSQGTTLTMTFNIDDEPGVLSEVLKNIADFGANILTIHQIIPINGIAALSLSIQVLQTTGDISGMLERLEAQQGVHQVKLLAKE